VRPCGGSAARRPRRRGRRRAATRWCLPLRTERGREELGAARFQQASGLRQEGLGEQQTGRGAHRREVGRAAAGEEADAFDPELGEQAGELVLDDVGQRARDQQFGGITVRRGHLRHERGKARILAFGEGGLDAAARIAEDADPGAGGAEPARGERQIELDHLGRAAADQEQGADFRPALDQARHHAVKLDVEIGHAGEVALFDDRGGEARLGEDHHAGGRLHQMRTGARADD
jgi:hypothetical protein